MNYNNLLQISPQSERMQPGMHVTKVTKKPYGFRVMAFNNYITEFYFKIVINPDKSAKAHWRVEKNYNPVQRFTTYHGSDGEEITRKEFYALQHVNEL